MFSLPAFSAAPRPNSDAPADVRRTLTVDDALRATVRAINLVP